MSNAELLNKLKETTTSKEGNLLIYCDGADAMQSQVSFLQKYLKKINPKFVLETGTNLGCFSVLLKEILSDTKLITFGIDNFSSQCVNIIEDYYKDNFIEFIHGDSRITFSEYDSKDKEIDFAWIDGGHAFDVCLSDLINCDRLNIENIFVDDYGYPTDQDNPTGSVRLAVNEFCHTHQYNIVDFEDNGRNIVYLKKD